MTAPAGNDGTTTEIPPTSGDATTGDAENGYKPPTSQADLDRIIESRLARERAKFADYDDLKAKAEKHDELELELSSEADKKAHTARQEAAQEADAKFRPMLAETAFRVAIGDRKTQDEVDEFVADLNLARFLTDDGKVDTAKVLSRVEQFAPAMGATPPPRTGPSSNGMGNRGKSTPGVGSVAAGRDMYAETHPKK